MEGETTTFGELVSKANQLSNKFADLGLTRGDVVAGLLLNGTEFYEITLACTQSGLYFVPINTHLAGPEVEYIVRDCDASVLIVHAELADKVVGRIEDAVPHRVVIGSAPGRLVQLRSLHPLRRRNSRHPLARLGDDVHLRHNWPT
ncbi:hypothetical protein G9444_0363 [Rhodococcus erythropolis]|uniref:AMP-dependent synthetase/ligase domain-containing protein n=2 Tax=Rhodococcus erythropolis TaxID=1833 RepID=A0A6G9CKS6_RHOER|nr:hypothetical protein G9444_0363 [Rhodococcus erythropolis]